MNFKSKILKLSIIIMLVLVLIPAIAAEDSSESFFVEYADESDEDIVEESDSIDEVEQTQVEDVSVDSEIHSSEVVDEPVIIDNNNEEKYEEIQIQGNQPEETIEEKEDTNLIPEQEDCSDVVTHNIIEYIESNSDIHIEYYDNVKENIHNDIGEYSDRELTIENISIINYGSIFISKSNINFNLIEYVLVTSAANNYEEQSFKRSSIKDFELKNNLLINQDISFILADNRIADIDGNLIICNDKTSNDFIFSIDNSVVGDGNLIIFVTTSFCLNFDPCFDAFICRDFFDVEYIFGGNSRDCCWSFCRNFQEICSCDLILL